MSICGNKPFKNIKRIPKMLQFILPTAQNIVCTLSRTIFISVPYEIIKLHSRKKLVCFYYKPDWFVRNGCIKHISNTESDTEEIAGLQTNCDL